VTALYKHRGIHTGRPGAVLGSGPSLPDDLVFLPAGVVTVSVNAHALRLVACNYSAANDRHGAEHLHKLKPALICRWSEFASIRVDYGIGEMTAVLATQALLVMGCAPVFLCGFDCGGLPPYFYKTDTPPRERSQSWHLAQWRKALDLPGAEHIRPVSGPLTALFNQTKEGAPAMAETTKKKNPNDNPNDPVDLKVSAENDGRRVELPEQRSAYLVGGTHKVSTEIAEAALRAGLGEVVAKKGGAAIRTYTSEK
jgi:hypothetical protein